MPQHQISPEDIFLAEGSQYFVSGLLSTFNQWVEKVPPSTRGAFIKALYLYIEKNHGSVQAIAMARRLAHHPSFEKYFGTLPTTWEQGLPFIHHPSLKTRVSVSFFEHPWGIHRPIDVSYQLVNAQGQNLGLHKTTLGFNQTHTVEISSLLKNNPLASVCGLFLLQIAEKDLGSLRIYAQWYNAQALTTTHEKACLVNQSRYLIYPVIVINSNHDTYLLFSNISNQPLKVRLQLQNIEKKFLPGTKQIELPSKVTCFLKISDIFSEAASFLNNHQGMVIVEQTEGLGMYYYLIHNKDKNAWQIQHL